MKTLSFKEFLAETSKDNTFALARSGKDSKGLENKATRDTLNAALARVTAEPFITPYIGLGVVSKILAYAHIIVPQNVFFAKDSGEMVFKVTTNMPFGPDIHQQWGSQDEGSGYFVYFSYDLTDAGFYNVFAELVSSAELDELLEDEEDLGENKVNEAHGLRESDEYPVRVKATDKHGATHYYTGKAGQDWVSKDKANAWTGYNRHGAKRFADLHNKHTGIHGLTFAAEELDEEESLDEAKTMRLISTHTHENRTAKVYRDNDWGQHIVKYHTDGQHHVNADSHHDDGKEGREEAQTQAETLVKNGYSGKAHVKEEELDEEGKTPAQIPSYTGWTPPKDKKPDSPKKPAVPLSTWGKKINEEPEINLEAAPPGREGMVKALKSKFPDGSPVPYIMAWKQHHRDQAIIDAQAVQAPATSAS